MITPDDGLHARVQTAVRTVLEESAETWADYPIQIDIYGNPHCMNVVFIYWI